MQYAIQFKDTSIKIAEIGSEWDSATLSCASLMEGNIMCFKVPAS